MIYGSWDMKCNRHKFFVILGHFLPFYPPKSPKKENIKKKWNTHLEISSFYTSARKTMVIGYTVPEIWHMTDVIVIFILDYTFLFYPPNSPKNENFKKMKKTPGDIIILYKCTKNHDHMLYCSWDMMCDRCNCYFSFWAIFCPSTPLTAQKTKISKKFKKRPEISSFNTNVPKITIICFIVPEIWHVTVIIVIFNFGLFFALLPLWQPEKWKLQKNEKNELGDIIILHMCTNNYD